AIIKVLLGLLARVRSDPHHAIPHRRVLEVVDLLGHSSSCGDSGCAVQCSSSRTDSSPSFLPLNLARWSAEYPPLISISCRAKCPSSCSTSTMSAARLRLYPSQRIML